MVPDAARRGARERPAGWLACAGYMISRRRNAPVTNAAQKPPAIKAYAFESLSMTDTLATRPETYLRPAKATDAPAPAPGPFDTRDAADAPPTLGALATILLVLYPACASVLIVLAGVLLAGPMPVA